MKQAVLGLITSVLLGLVVFASAQSTAYVYLQGTWVNETTNPPILVVINSPYVEIGAVLANVSYGAPLSCTTDLRRRGEDNVTIMLTEHPADVNSGCPNDTEATLRYDSSTDTLIYASNNGSSPSVAVLRRLNPNTDVVDHGLFAPAPPPAPMPTAPMPAEPVRAPTSEK